MVNSLVGPAVEGPSVVESVVDISLTVIEMNLNNTQLTFSFLVKNSD